MTAAIDNKVAGLYNATNTTQSYLTNAPNLVGIGTIITGTWASTLIGVTYGGTGANLSGTGGTSQVLKQTSVGGTITVGQLAVTDLSTGTTGSGTIVLATSGVLVTPALGTPSSGTLTNCSGTAASLTSGTCTTVPALAGDITTTGSTNTTTLATVNSNTGSFGSSSAVPVITVNGKGLITAVSTAAISGGSGTANLVFYTYFGGM
jgi:hypothetical protein